MIDHATLTRLQDMYRRENRSFLQYVTQASPWYRDGDRPLVDKVQKFAAEEAEALDTLAAWMDSKNIPLPYLGAFPSSFMNYNYVDIRKLMKALVVEQRKELADLETDVRSLSDADARLAVNSLVELNRSHLNAMGE
jgi:hypothetical protein